MWTTESQSPCSLCSFSTSAADLVHSGPDALPDEITLFDNLDALWGSTSHSEEPAPQVGLGLCHGGFCLGHQDRENQLILPVGLSFSLEPGWSLCPVGVSDPAPGPPETGDPDSVRRCPSV